MILGYILVLILVGIDQLSKLIVVNNMDLYQYINFIDPLIHFRFTYNTGAAWSILSNHTWLLTIISIIASCAILYLLKDFNLKKHKVYSFSLVFIAGGAIGNLIDRAFRSEGVVDFLELGFMEFPIFNLADLMLTAGVILILYHLLFISKDGSLPFMQKKKKEEEENIE